MNPLIAYGYDALAERLPYGAGVCGFIVPDLPLRRVG